MGKESVKVGPAFIGGGVRTATAEPSLEANLSQVRDPKDPKKMLRFVKVEAVDERTKNRFKGVIDGKILVEQFVEKYRKAITL
jgi:hypothetical protein